MRITSKLDDLFDRDLSCLLVYSAFFGLSYAQLRVILVNVYAWQVPAGSALTKALWKVVGCKIVDSWKRGNRDRANEIHRIPSYSSPIVNYQT